MNNLKFTSAQQASEIYQWKKKKKNITVKLYIKNMQQFDLMKRVGSSK